MSLWVCRRCSTRFAVGLSYCPQCTGTDVERDEPMAKTTVHGGGSNKYAEPAGGDETWPGSSSEASTEKPETSPERNEPADPKPARTTGSRSRKGRTGSSSVRSTDGPSETT